MYFGDHPPPHFNVITRSDEATFAADDSKVDAGGDVSQWDAPKGSEVSEFLIGI